LCFDRGGYAISATASGDLNYIDPQKFTTKLSDLDIRDRDAGPEQPWSEDDAAV
jgi:hypothetical protein